MNLNVANCNQSPRVFIINLRKDSARFDSTSAPLISMGVPLERYRAVDGRKFSRKISAMFPTFYSREKKRNLSTGELACSLSHLGIWRKMVRQQIPYALIFEDDAQICDCDAFFEVWSSSLAPVMRRYDLVKFEGIMAPWTSLAGPSLDLARDYKIITPLRPSLGSAGYAVSLHGAARLIEKFNDNKTDPLDHFISEYERHCLRYGEFRPRLIQQDFQLTSVLNENRRSEHINSLTRDSPSAQIGAKFTWLLLRFTRLFLWLREYL